jgi:hypothetical protein
MNENLENIMYIETAKNNILKMYKINLLIPLRLNTLSTVVNNLLILSRDYKLSLRKSIISSILYQMSSDQYIESKIDWSNYNSLNMLITDIINDLEDDIYDDHYKNSFCYKYFGIKIEC